MKKVIVLLAILISVSFLMADFNFYGSVRTGWWYTIEDEDYTGSESRFDFGHKFYSDSRVGMDYVKDGFTAKVELGLNESYVTLRHAYGEQDLGAFKILAGRTFSGFADFAAQGFGFGSDNYLIGYGMLFDGMNTMLKFTTRSGAYISLIEPKKMDFMGIGNYSIDALFPKINIGMHYNMNALNLHPTIGFAMSQYNEDHSDYDESIVAYVAAITGCYEMKPMKIQGQIGFGQNIGDYGFKTLGNANAYWNYAKEEIVNTTTMSAYAQMFYGDFVVGGGFTSNDHDDLGDPDAAMSIFGQYRLKMGNICLMPEVGILDMMENGKGEKEGSILYFGSQIRVSIP